MTKKTIFCFIVPLLMLAGLFASAGYAGVSATGILCPTGWPDLDGMGPKVQTCNDPNELPGYLDANDNETSERGVEDFIAGRCHSQTFTTPATDAMRLKRISIRAGGQGNINTGLYTLHLFDINATPGGAEFELGGYVPATSGPYPGVDFLSGCGFYPDPCLLVNSSNYVDSLISFDFNEVHGIDLEPNHLYGFEIWGATNTENYPIVWVRYQEATSTYAYGRGYGTYEGGIPWSDFSVSRNQLTGGSVDFVLAVYGDFADGNAYHPEPRKFATGVTTSPTLTWKPGKWAKTHKLWFSSNFVAVSRRVPVAYKGTFTDTSYTPGPLALNTTYYWRVDEYNDTPTVPVPQPHPGDYFWGEANNPSGDYTDRATIYRFTTWTPQAHDPTPASGTATATTFSIKAPCLQWMAGALTREVNGHRVYFGTDYNAVNDATTSTPLIYRGEVTDPCYPLKNLVPDYTLTSGTTYYWRVDEVENETTTHKGYIWSFVMPNPAAISLDNFSDAALWQTGYRLPYTPPGGSGSNADQNTVSGSITTAANVLTLNYDNTYTLNGPWSETMHDFNYISSTGADFTLGGAFAPKAIAIQFDGDITNTLNSLNVDNDKLYIGIQDADGKLGVAYYSDSYAAQRQIALSASNLGTREWRVSLPDLAGPNSVDLTRIRKVFFGIGSPRGGFQNLGYGGMGNVRFANLKIYVQHCNPSPDNVSMVAGDLAGPRTAETNRFTRPDCAVNYNDLFYLVTDWLFNEPNLDYTASQVNPGTTNLTVWYAFDEGSGTYIADSSGNGRDATLNNVGTFTWAYTGHQNTGYCLNFEPGYRTWVECPTSVIEGTTGQSFAFWVWYNATFLPSEQYPSVLMMHSNPPGGADSQQIETQIPVPWVPTGGWVPRIRWVNQRLGSVDAVTNPVRASAISSRWNHYALVYDTTTTTMTIYLNGAQLISKTDATLTSVWPTPGSVRLGTRSNANPPTWGWWQGKLDDLRIYSKALSPNEVQWLATDGTGTRNMQAVFSEPDDFNSNNTVALPGGPTVKIINFNDFAGLASHWLNQQLWP